MRAITVAASSLLAAALLGAAALRAGTAPEASPLYGVTVPDGFRDWPLIGVAQETGALDELRAVVGNAPALQAYRAGTLPFPDGTVLVKRAWKRTPSREFEPAFVPGAATTIQVMVKDSKRYPETGGWGFGRFIDGTPTDAAHHETCFACHQANVRDHDFVFTRLAP